MSDHPTTQAVRWLRERGVPFTPLLYKYVEHGGTRHAAAELGAPEHSFAKTLIMETESGAPLVVLMHGDREVSTKQLARLLGVKRVEPCAPETANRHSGYFVGGTSPFGTRRRMPVYAEATLFDLPEVFVNGGHRGFMLKMAPADLEKALDLTRVSVAMQEV